MHLTPMRLRYRGILTHRKISALDNNKHITIPGQPNWTQEMQVDIHVQDDSSKLIDELKQELHDECTPKQGVR